MTSSAEISETKRARRPIPHLVKLIFVAAIICALRYAQVFFSGAALDSPVHEFYLRPTVQFFAESVNAGSLPRWNPYCYLGMPMLPGLMPGAHYPLNVVLLIQNYDVACAVFFIVHQLIAFGGAYLVASKFGLPAGSHSKPVAPAVAAFVYVMVQSLLVGDSNLALCAILAWIPWAAFGVSRCLPEEGPQPHRAGLVVVNSVFVALMFLSGAIVLAFVGTVCLFVVLAVMPVLSKRIAYVGTYSISIIVALCLAAPVLLPTFEWMKDGNFGDGIVNLWSASPICFDGGAVFAAKTMGRTAFDELKQKRLAALDSVREKIGHHGRYLAIDAPLIKPNTNMSKRISTPLGYLGHPSGQYRKLTNDLLRTSDRESLTQFCKLTGTSFVVDATQGQQIVVTPPAYSIDAWQWASDRREIDDAVLKNKSFDPLRHLWIEKLATVEIDMERLDKMPLSQVSPPSGPPLADSVGSNVGETVSRAQPVDILAYEPEHVALSVRVEHPSFVVLPDTFYPGWKAYVDSTPAPNYRANGIGRAVFVTEGSHLVAFDYRPDSWRWGETIALCALILNAILPFFWLSRLLGKTVRFLSVGKFE